jgi:enamine deaminase RidA (YjgF/YER057c/UK114 family)
VFRVTSYHARFDGDQVFGKMVANLEKWTPGHAPIWTCVGVTALALPQMNIEIEVVAVDGK